MRGAHYFTEWNGTERNKLRHYFTERNGTKLYRASLKFLILLRAFIGFVICHIKLNIFVRLAYGIHGIRSRHP